MKSTTLFAIVWRVAVAVATQTFFQPDEYFQSLEVAHHAVFGYGHLTWEWLATPPIRSVIFPFVYVPVYWVLKQSGLDNGKLLVSLCLVYVCIYRVNSTLRLDFSSQSSARCLCIVD